MTEKAIEQSLIKEVKRRAGVMYKWVSPGRVGVPDRIVLLPGGKIIFIEVKKPGGIVSLKQQHELTRLKALGFQAEVIDNLEDFKELLNGI